MEIKYPILGIDVSKAKLDVCMLEEGKAPTLLMIPNTPKGFASLQRSFPAHSVATWTVCLEATNVYSTAIAVYLHEHDATVILANPAAVHAYMQAEMRRAKTDKADAASIASFARAMAEHLRPWHPLPACYAELRDLTRRLHDIRKNGARTKNQIEQLQYLTSPAKAAIARSLRADLAHQQKQARAILIALRSCLRKNEDLNRRFERLNSAKGVGEMTALTLMAEVPNIRQFAHAKQLAAFAGITPRIRHSGTKTPVSQPISKMGSARLRQAMYMAALSAKRYNPPLARFAQRLREKGKKPMLINIAVARKLLHQLYAIDTHQTLFDPNYQNNHIEMGTT